MPAFFLWFALTTHAAPCGPGDSDGDSILDVDEDNGSPDGDCDNDHCDGDGIPNYLDPDDDGDSVPTADEATVGANGCSPDTDGDFVLDGVEWPLGDSDSDGVPDIVDQDDDGDDIGSFNENLVAWQDPDGDGLPNYLDLDSDGDTWPDKAEGDGDMDGDGIPNWVDTIDYCTITVDHDLDGIDDREELRRGSDPNNPDTDDDSVDDNTEYRSGIDTDGDGRPDHLDADDDGDSIPTADELGPECPGGAGVLFHVRTGPIAGCVLEQACPDGTVLTARIFQDTDSDGRPDYLDADDDGDGIPTAQELGLDEDCDQLVDHLDPDNLDGPCAESPTETPTDTGTDPNTGTGPTDGPKHPSPSASGCGCTSDRNPTTPFGAALLGALILARRRRKM